MVRIGDVVSLRDNRIAVVRYLDLRTSKIGIEVRIPSEEGLYGECDGTLDGKQYFKAPPKSSSFIPFSDIYYIYTPLDLLEAIIELRDIMNEARRGSARNSNGNSNRASEDDDNSTSPRRGSNSRAGRHFRLPTLHSKYSEDSVASALRRVVTKRRSRKPSKNDLFLQPLKMDCDEPSLDDSSVSALEMAGSASSASSASSSSVPTAEIRLRATPLPLLPQLDRKSNNDSIAYALRSVADQRRHSSITPAHTDNLRLGKMAADGSPQTKTESDTTPNLRLKKGERSSVSDTSPVSHRSLHSEYNSTVHLVPTDDDDDSNHNDETNEFEFSDNDDDSDDTLAAIRNTGGRYIHRPSAVGLPSMMPDNSNHPSLRLVNHRNNSNKHDTLTEKSSVRSIGNSPRSNIPSEIQTRSSRNASWRSRSAASIFSGNFNPDDLEEANNRLHHRSNSKSSSNIFHTIPRRPSRGATEIPPISQIQRNGPTPQRSTLVSPHGTMPTEMQTQNPSQIQPNSTLPLRRSAPIYPEISPRQPSPAHPHSRTPKASNPTTAFPFATTATYTMPRPQGSNNVAPVIASPRATHAPPARPEKTSPVGVAVPSTTAAPVSFTGGKQANILHKHKIFPVRKKLSNGGVGWESVLLPDFGRFLCDNRESIMRRVWEDILKPNENAIGIPQFCNGIEMLIYNYLSNKHNLSLSETEDKFMIKDIFQIRQQILFHIMPYLYSPERSSMKFTFSDFCEMSKLLLKVGY